MKNKVSQIISCLFILLFIYASISKFITFESFQVQLAQSPLLTAYAGIISYMVLVVEIGTAVLLLFKQTRLWGLYLSLGLMTAFTVYIYLILNYSDFIPCSCGGILEKLGWTEHLWFNIAFVVLAITGIQLLTRRPLYTLQEIWKPLGTLLVSSLIIILLFLSSEHIIKKENNFTRRFRTYGVLEDKTLDLGLNSYYFAGYHNKTVYLANKTTALRLLSVDSIMAEAKDHLLTIHHTDLPFSYLQTKVLYPHFFIADGSVPVIYRGKIDQWEADTVSVGQAFFSDFTPIDSTHIAFKGMSAKTNESALGILDFKTKTTTLYPNILEKQVDGVFDVDGMLRYSQENKELVYTYYYRNQYSVTDQFFSLIHRGNTIDTTHTAQLEVTQLKSGEHKISAPAITVNKNTIVHRNLLFNISNLMGKLEPKAMWKQAVIVDVYDFNARQYIVSFHVEHRGDHKLRDMLVTDTHFYGLFGNEMVRYQLAKSITDHYTRDTPENPKTE